jgi:hypothetical protein
LHGAYLGDAVGFGGDGGRVLGQFLARSRVVFVCTAPFARLGGQNLSFWLQVPNSHINSLDLPSQGKSCGRIREREIDR